VIDTADCLVGLVGLFGSDVGTTVEQAAAALTYIAEGSLGHTQAVVDTPHVIAGLAALLAHANPARHRIAISAFTAIVEGLEDQRDAILAAGVRPRLEALGAGADATTAELARECLALLA
jgi:SAM-dependent MidA family methyltransferase